MGLATGLAFAARGLSVTGYDVNPRVARSVARGVAPYHEEGLGELLRREVRSRRFSVAENLDALLRSAEVLFLCLPTPSLASGKIDLRPMKRGTAALARALRGRKGYHLVVVKSTVVPGTTEGVLGPLLRRLSRRPARDLGIAVNPEFLAEGSMVRDALSPERIVIGVQDARARRRLRAVYRPFRARFHSLSPTGAELVKYSSNAFLALKVSFANEISRLTERLGLGIDPVMSAVGADPRIGARFLAAGPGFGGSCFEKDLRALVARSHELGVRLRSGEVTLEINRAQAGHALDLVREAVGPLRGKTVTVLGLSFKAGTDDVRESRAFPLVAGLVAEGARVRVHDPVALANFRRAWVGRPDSGPSSPVFADTIPQALAHADVAVLQADWPVYRRWTPAWTRRMKTPVLVDLRRSVDPRRAAAAGLRIHALGVGRGVERAASVGRTRGRTEARGGA